MWNLADQIVYLIEQPSNLLKTLVVFWILWKYKQTLSILFLRIISCVEYLYNECILMNNFLLYCLSNYRQVDRNLKKHSRYRTLFLSVHKHFCTFTCKGSLDFSTHIFFLSSHRTTFVLSLKVTLDQLFSTVKQNFCLQKLMRRDLFCLLIVIFLETTYRLSLFWNNLLLIVLEEIFSTELLLNLVVRSIFFLTTQVDKQLCCQF